MPCELTLHGALDMAIALRAMREARDVVIFELGHDEQDDASVLAMRCSILSLQAIYSRVVSTALDRQVRRMLSEEVFDDAAI